MSPRDVQHARRRTPPRPLHDLLLLLPLLSAHTGSEGSDANIHPPQVDWLASDPDLVVTIAQHAGSVARIAAHGVTAIGQLLAQSAPEIELADISGDVVEAIGRLLAELGELAAVCGYLEASARHATRDYEPRTGRRVRPAAVAAHESAR